MTVSTTNRKDTFTGDNLTTAFPTTFIFFEDTDIEVIERTITTGAEVTKILTTDYTVSGGDTTEGAVGTVNAVSAPADTVQWIIRRVLPRTQTHDLPIAGNLPAVLVENSDDRSVLLVQELEEDISRAPKFAVTDPDSSIGDIPNSVDRASKLAGYDSAGKPNVQTVASIGAVVISDDNPADTGTAAPGTSSEISRSDHVHAIPTNGIVSAMITALNVTTAKIAALAITTAKIAANAVDNTKLKAALIGDFTSVTALAADSILIGDASDSGNSKRSLIQDILDLVTGGITLGTPQTTTSGTSITFTAIPAGTKRITINFSGVSTSGTSIPIVQLGDAGGIETTGYLGNGFTLGAGLQQTTGLAMAQNWTAASIAHGSMVISLMDSSANKWASLCIIGMSDDAVTRGGASAKSLSAELTQLAITTTGGSETFDAGQINISFE